MPAGFVRTRAVDESGSTWRETGTLPLPFETAVAALKGGLAAGGWAPVHDIAGGGAAATRRILFFSGATNDLLVAAWPSGDSETAVRWGLSAKAGESGQIENRQTTGNQ
ncbi:MAG: hypothetical protein IJ678_01835 [Kiritimatiellae bacterium]|nr:hypothetical protein [Kiritimatiellia bacterium]